MKPASKRVIVVGGGTSGSALAARLSEATGLDVTLLEIGADDDAYGDGILDPARAPEAWLGMQPVAMTAMQNGAGVIPMIQGRLLGGTSAVNGLATLRGLPEDYDGWAAMGLSGWGWDEVKDTFIAAETDRDFGPSPIHGDRGPLPVRRWRRKEMGRAQLAFYDGMVELGVRTVDDINDPRQLPGLGIFPVTVDGDASRVTTSRAYLTPQVRARPNLTIRTRSEVTSLIVDKRRVKGVVLSTGESIEGDEVVVTAGALWTPNLLMQSGIGPAGHLADHGIAAHVDLPVGSTMSDHIGPGLRYRHDGPRGGTAGPAQSLLIGASNGVDIDYHAFPIAPPLRDGPTEFVMAVFLLRSSGKGSVRLAEGLARARSSLPLRCRTMRMKDSGMRSCVLRPGRRRPPPGRLAARRLIRLTSPRRKRRASRASATRSAMVTWPAPVPWERCWTPIAGCWASRGCVSPTPP